MYHYSCRYETVVLQGEDTPVTPEHTTHALDPDPYLPRSKTTLSTRSRSSDSELANRRASPSWQRTSSDMSLLAASEADSVSIQR